MVSVALLREFSIASNELIKCHNDIIRALPALQNVKGLVDQIAHEYINGIEGQIKEQEQ